MSKERIKELYFNFSDYINGKKDIPKRFLENDPLRKFAANDPIAELVYSMYQSYKNGPKDIDPQNISLKKDIGLIQSSVSSQ